MTVSQINRSYKSYKNTREDNYTILGLPIGCGDFHIFYQSCIIEFYAFPIAIVLIDLLLS